MRHLVIMPMLGTLALGGQLAAQAATRPDGAAHHQFVIENFKLENGTTLPRALVVYGTYGKLNAAKSNAILLPSHYLADHHGYDWLLGPAGALDTTRVFLVMTELFGNGRSSSPSNTPEPLHGPRFPIPTIRDNVEAVRQLLTKDLGIQHLAAIIGFSMGAEQAFQWAVSQPKFADRIVATSGTAKSWPHGWVRLESEIDAITSDSGWHGGDYTVPPTGGIHSFALVWSAWLFSQEWWRKELWRSMNPNATSVEQFVDGFSRNFIPNADANDLILQMRTWEKHDVGTTPGFDGDVKKALRSIKVPVLYMPSATDLYFPVEDARYEAGFIPGVIFKPIPSIWGHPAGAGLDPVDKAFLNREIGAFLRPVLARVR